MRVHRSRRSRHRELLHRKTGPVDLPQTRTSKPASRRARQRASQTDRQTKQQREQNPSNPTSTRRSVPTIPPTAQRYHSPPNPNFENRLYKPPSPPSLPLVRTLRQKKPCQAPSTPSYPHQTPTSRSEYPAGHPLSAQSHPDSCCRSGCRSDRCGRRRTRRWPRT